MDDTVYSAFLASEIGEMLPTAITLTRKTVSGTWIIPNLGGIEIESVSEADARAKLLIHLIENSIIDVKSINPPMKYEKPLEQIEKELRESIIEVVPEIVELTFGCWISRPYDQYRHGGVVIGSDKNAFRVMYDSISMEIESQYDIQKSEILGRPITLADVLRTIPPSYLVDSLGKFWEFSQGGPVYEVVPLKVNWNLSQPLDGQSEETKRFIHSVIFK